MMLYHQFDRALGLFLVMLSCSEYPFAAASRFTHFALPNGEWATTSIGPANPPPQISELFGAPSWQTCYYIAGITMKGRGTPNSISDNRLTDLLEVLGPGAVALKSGPASLQVPKTWLASSLILPENKGNCQISLMTLTIPGEHNSDLATYKDIFMVTQNVINTGLLDDKWGGYQVFGGENNLVIFVYAIGSEYDNSYDHISGCVRRGRDKVGSIITLLFMRALALSHITKLLR